MGFWRNLTQFLGSRKVSRGRHFRATSAGNCCSWLLLAASGGSWLQLLEFRSRKNAALNINIDIGTKILYFQCFFTTDMFLFCKTILYSGNCRICRDLAFASVKTRFKAILKKLDFSAQIDFSAHIYFFHELLPPRRATQLRSL